MFTLLLLLMCDVDDSADAFVASADVNYDVVVFVVVVVDNKVAAVVDVDVMFMLSFMLMLMLLPSLLSWSLSSVAAGGRRGGRGRRVRGKRGAAGRCKACHEAPVDAREHRRLPGKRAKIGLGIAHYFLVLVSGLAVFVWF